MTTQKIICYNIFKTIFGAEKGCLLLFFFLQQATETDRSRAFIFRPWKFLLETWKLFRFINIF